MKIVYTSLFTVGTSPILIQRGDTPGNGVIPNKYSIGLVKVIPITATDVLQSKGTDEASDWITENAGAGIGCERCDDGDRIYFYVKSSGSVAVKLYAEGTEE